MKSQTKHVLFKMIIFTIILAILCIIFFILYKYFQLKWMLSLAITFLTIFYHFAMRLIVGEAVTIIFLNNDFPENKLGFKIKKSEFEFYKKINVKKFKKDIITAKPEQFDLKKVSPKELLHNIMQAELVHRIIMILSFVPVFFSIPFGMPLIFISTSVLACLADLFFVIVQRYNRPRVNKLIAITERQKHKK